MVHTMRPAVQQAVLAHQMPALPSKRDHAELDCLSCNPLRKQSGLLLVETAVVYLQQETIADRGHRKLLRKCTKPATQQAKRTTRSAMRWAPVHAAFQINASQVLTVFSVALAALQAVHVLLL